jgi:hypothetical protein
VGAGVSIGEHFEAGGSASATCNHGVVSVGVSGDVAALVGLDVDVGVSVDTKQIAKDGKAVVDAVAPVAAPVVATTAATATTTANTVANVATSVATSAANSVSKAAKSATNSVKKAFKKIKF